MTSLPCPICSKGQLSKKYLEAHDLVTGEIFTLLECDFCSVKQTFPIPDDLSRHYNTDLCNLMRKKPNRIHSLFKNILMQIELSRITKNVRVKEFLDIGCGAGDFAKILYEKGYKISCVDSAIEKPYYIKGIDVNYHIIDYNNYEIENFKGMDNGTIILRHVLEHIKTPNLFIKKILAYGGDIFYIVVPNISSLKNKILRSYNCYLDPPRHIWHFNKTSLEVFFERFNLKIINFGYYTIPTFIPSLYRFLRIKRVPERIYKYFEPQGPIATLSLPLDWLLPNDVIWFILRKK